MRIFRSLILAALAALPLVPMALAQNAGTSTSGGWVPRTALRPEPGKLVVPKGYKAEVFVAGLDTPSSAAVDREGNVWVAVPGYLYWGQGFPSNSGFADPDNHGWTNDVDPFWEKHGDPALPKTARDPVCRDIVHTGLNVKSADGRLTGALLPAGVPAKPGMTIKAQVPCGGSIMRVKIDKQGSDGIYQHKDMEVYAMGFRNQSGVRFGPKGSRFENALAVSDNGVNDLGYRRIANGAEKLWIVTEKGQDAGFPDKEGMGFVTNKRFSMKAYNGAKVDRPHPQLYIGDKPWVPQMPPYRFPPHVEGVRGVPLIVANPNPNGSIT